MTERRQIQGGFFADDEETVPVRRRVVARIETGDDGLTRFNGCVILRPGNVPPPSDLAELLDRMDCVMRIRTNRDGLWHARAHGCPRFARGDTAEEAMRNALAEARA